MSTKTETPPPALAAVMSAAKPYAEAVEILEGKVMAHQSAQRELTNTHFPGIKFALRKCADLKAAVVRALELAHDHFTPPLARTITIYGLKLGFQKGKGKVEFDDGDDVVARIEKFMPEKIDDLVRLKRVPNKDALAMLPAADLRRLGVTVTDCGDQVVIKSATGEVEKLVNRLLKDAGEESGVES